MLIGDFQVTKIEDSVEEYFLAIKTGLGMLTMSSMDSIIGM